MSSPHHASIPAWAWAVPLLASALVALKLFHIVPSDDPYVLVLAGLFLGATVFAAVHHAEVLALKLGEPFGSILLAVAVTVIEAGLIVSIMLAGAEGSERVARDTVFAAVMIVLNGVVGSLPRPWGGQALRAGLPASGRGLRARGARDFGHAGADPAQLRRGRFRPVLFHSAAGGHRPHVAGPLVRVRVRANHQASRLLPRCAKRRRFWRGVSTTLPAS